MRMCPAFLLLHFISGTDISYILRDLHLLLTNSQIRFSATKDVLINVLVKLRNQRTQDITLAVVNNRKTRARQSNCVQYSVSAVFQANFPCLRRLPALHKINSGIS